MGEIESSSSSVAEMPSSKSSKLLRLPSEIIHHVLSFLSPLELSNLSQTCRLLHEHAMSDSLWRPHVFYNLPMGTSFPLPAQVPSWRSLYISHHPYWFLPRHSIWFSDTLHTGKLLLARYDPRTDAIEAYALVAARGKTDTFFWEANPNVLIQSFSPKVQLDLNQPVLKLDRNCWAAPEDEESVSERNAVARSPSPPSTSMTAADLRDDYTTRGRRKPTLPLPSKKDAPHSLRARLSREIVMPIHRGSSRGIFSQFSLARTFPTRSIGAHTAVWPPQTLPAAKRVRNTSANGFTGSGHRPQTLDEVCETAFRLRKWVSFARHRRRLSVPPGIHNVLHGAGQVSDNHGNHGNGGDEEDSEDGTAEDGDQGDAGQPAHQVLQIPINSPPIAAITALAQNPVLTSVLGSRIGDDITTFATLDPHLYTPTPQKPWRGIWAGDYSGHGIEFLAVMQPDNDLADSQLPREARLVYDSSEPGLGPWQLTSEAESPEDSTEQARRRRSEDGGGAGLDESIYRGRLEAVKLTGDLNVPRGEYTFIAFDLGEEGLVRVAQEDMFRGARVVRSVGHIAQTGFRHDEYLPSQLIMISENRLAQYWEMLGHISFYERVDIDQFLHVA